MARVKNIQFNRANGQVLIVGDDAAIYFPNDALAARLRELSARDLNILLGLEISADVHRVCRGFRNPEGKPLEPPRDPQPVSGDGPTAWYTEQQADAIAKAAPPPPPQVQTDRRVLIERFGVGVDRKPADDGSAHLDLWMYPVTRSGAMSPVGTKVTRPTLEFLREVNRMLGTDYQMENFRRHGELPPLDDDGMPF